MLSVTGGPRLSAASPGVGGSATDRSGFHLLMFFGNKSSPSLSRVLRQPVNFFVSGAGPSWLIVDPLMLNSVSNHFCVDVSFSDREALDIV